MTEPEITESLNSCRTQDGETLDELSRSSQLLVVFLRHAGCPFCRETLADLSKSRAAIEKAGARLVVVHMATDEQALKLLSKYALDDVAQVSDPEQKLYRSFSLDRGSTGQVMGPRVWWSGFKAVVLAGHLPGKPIGDVFQLSGAFLVVYGKIARGFRHKTTADRPDYVDLATCERSEDDAARR